MADNVGEQDTQAGIAPIPVPNSMPEVGVSDPQPGTATSLFANSLIVTHNDGSVPQHLLSDENFSHLKHLAEGERPSPLRTVAFGLISLGVGFLKNTWDTIWAIYNNQWVGIEKFNFIGTALCLICLAIAGAFLLASFKRKPKETLDDYFKTLADRPRVTIPR